MGILRGLSQLGTVAGGYMQQQERDRLAKIQEEDLAMRREDQAYQREARNEERTARQSLKDAYAPRTAQEGVAVGDSGNQQFYAGNGLSPELADSMRAEAEMRGEVAGRPTGLRQASAYGISAGSKGQITTDKPDLNTMNSPEAQDERAVQALRMSGKPGEAMQLQAGRMGLESTRLGIKKTQGDLDAAARDRIAEETAKEIMGASLPEHFADMVTKQEGYGLKGVNSKVFKSPDGKTWGLSVTMPDGAEKQLPFQFSNDAAGVRQAQLAFIGRANPKMFMELSKLTSDQQDKFFNQNMKTQEHGLAVTRSAKEAKLADSTIGLQSAQADAARALSGLRDTQSDAGGYRPGGGGGGKVDHFDEKEWSSAYGKMDKTAVSIPNEMGDKDVVHPDLSAARRAIFNEVRASGGYNPAQAVELADEKVLALRRRAIDMVEAARANDKKSTLTVDKAITDLLRRAQSAGGQAQPAAAQPAQNTPPITKPAAAAGLASATQSTQEKPPTTQEVQEFFRAKQKQVAEAMPKFKSDQRVADLEAKRADALRRGKSYEANGYVDQINTIKKSYGL